MTGAEMVLEFGQLDDVELPAVAAALAVLTGIAAADAACCAALGTRSRSQDHRQAVALVATVTPNGDQMARDLNRLLDKKDGAHYGVIATTPAGAVAMLNWARRLIHNASEIVRR